MAENGQKEFPEGENEVTFNFTISEDHQSVLANHTWGGLQGGGLFEINFMLEHSPIPTKVTNRVTEQGVQEEIEREVPEEVDRDNKVTVYMPLSSLLSHYQWLEGKIEELEDQGVISRSDNEGGD